MKSISFVLSVLMMSSIASAKDFSMEFVYKGSPGLECSYTDCMVECRGSDFRELSAIKPRTRSVNQHRTEIHLWCSSYCEDLVSLRKEGLLCVGAEGPRSGPMISKEMKQAIRSNAQDKALKDVLKEIGRD